MNNRRLLFGTLRWLSPSANRMNLDFGHYVAAENENPVQFIDEKHDKIVSMHLKDRQKRSNGGGNLMWGTGDTPITRSRSVDSRQKVYKFPVTIEVEYDIPEGSNALWKRSNDVWPTLKTRCRFDPSSGMDFW